MRSTIRRCGCSRANGGPCSPGGRRWGDIWFHPDGGGWSEDFARETLSRQGFFIHELTHVWQTQKAGRFYLPLMRHPFCRYDYRLEPGKPFERYGLEQQAEIIRHRFLADHGGSPKIVPPRELLPFSTQGATGQR